MRRRRPPVDVALAGARVVDVALVSAGVDVAEARLHRFATALLGAGLSVAVVGPGESAAGPPGALVQGLGPRGGLRGRARRAAALPWRSPGLVTLAVGPDVVPAAALAGLARRRPWLVDLPEDYALLLRDRAWARRLGGAPGAVSRVLLRGCLAVAARADVTVVADEHVGPHRARRRRVVRNLPSGGYLPAPSPRGARPRAVYVGDLRASRGLLAMVDAVAAAPGWELDLVGPVRAADEPALRERLDRPGVGDRVRLHGRRPPAEAWQVARGAWVGLCLLEPTPAFVAAMPSKVYEYLGCGLPVLATPLPRVAALVAQSGAGVTVDAEAAGAVLASWAADPRLLDGMAAAARDWARRGLAGDPYAELAADVAGLVRRARARGGARAPEPRPGRPR